MHFQSNTMLIGNDGYKDEKQPQYCKENRGVAKTKKCRQAKNNCQFIAKTTFASKNTTGMNALA